MTLRATTLGPLNWVVRADWYGATRVVYGPASLASCVHYIVAQENPS